MNRITEQDSRYNNLERMPVPIILQGINDEDKTVAHSVEKAIPQIEELVTAIVPKMRGGGRLFYIGAGTSGRLGIVDASECPPTFGVPFDRVIGLIAGGDCAIRKAVEFAEDDTEQAWNDLLEYNISTQDVVIGIAASGSTPYVIGGIKRARQKGIVTGCIVCNLQSPLAAEAEYPIEVITGPEFVTGSTRMKAGTAQKLVLNMISTTVMIQLGKIRGNKMVDMQLSNKKLVNRAIRMIMQAAGTDEETAQELLSEYGNVRKAVDAFKEGSQKYL